MMGRLLPPALLLAILIAPAPFAAGEEDPRYRTTHPEIALRNLDHQLLQSQRRLSRQPDDIAATARLLDLLFDRALFLGTFSDFDTAMAVSEALVLAHPDNPEALFQRVRVLERLHHFEQAASLLDGIMASPMTPQVAAALQEPMARARIRIRMAQGEVDSVMSEVVTRTREQPSYANWSQLAFAHQARGEIEAAEQAYREALTFWDQITPFPIAWVEFQRGELYVGRDDDRAAKHYRRALDYLPDYVTARVHLAELLAEAGDEEGAVALLAAVNERNEDPEVDSRRAEFLLALGRNDEADVARNRAEQAYAALAQRHPLAFLDHITEFWLGAGDDPQQAWLHAQRHLANGASETALALAIAAASAANRAERCELIVQARPRQGRHAELDEMLTDHGNDCP